ncbi:MAG TPA: SAM-dependent methyltransferase [Usitatibacteraceae bacterium]|nr:SAM-dependent methyltransferase [Usitatibacteraceae bacterium]
MRPPLSRNQISELPEPDADAAAHSAACLALIRETIAREGGWISFARYMELALYAPGLGYYAAGARKFGTAGDFVTAPEISPLFGQALARAIQPVLIETAGEVLELGPGTGRLAFDILQECEALDAPPRRYALLEVSAELRQRQAALLDTLPSQLREKVVWLDALPRNIEGVILANEVLDVVPLHLVLREGARWLERGVADDAGQLTYADQPLQDVSLVARAEAIGASCFGGAVPEGYLIEISPAAGALVASLGESLSRGAALFIDYGFRAAEFYHPDRSMGTLMCHYRHRAHADPFLHPGLQDITAHVDFTAAAEAGAAVGLEVAGYTSQAQFLLAGGLAEVLMRVNRHDSKSWLNATSAVQRLTAPSEMGELFKVLGFTRGGVSFPAFAKARALAL